MHSHCYFTITLDTHATFIARPDAIANAIGTGELYQDQMRSSARADKSHVVVAGDNFAG